MGTSVLYHPVKLKRSRPINSGRDTIYKIIIINRNVRLTDGCHNRQLTFSLNTLKLEKKAMMHIIGSLARVHGAKGASTGFMSASGGTPLTDMGMTGLPSAWEMARRRPEEYRRKVGAVTRYTGAAMMVHD